MGKSVKQEKIYNEWIYSGKKMHIKHCFYPGCTSKNIIKSHVFQNNGVLTQIAEEGIVYMPKQKKEDLCVKLNRFGRKVATVFPGFCGKHDKKLFQSIEDVDWKVTPETVFLFSYRTFASQFQAKMEFIKRFDILSNNLEIGKNSPYLEGFRRSIVDFERDKVFFDEYLLNKKRVPLKYVSWEIRQSIKFAVSGFNTPYSDFEGNIIQKTDDAINHHIFYTILPYKGHCIAMIAWLKTDDHLFKSYTTRLRKLSNSERKQYLSNIALTISDDLVLSPVLVNKLTVAQKQLIEGEYAEMRVLYEEITGK